MEVWLSRERESEGTACVVVVSGTRFERFFLFFLHVQPRMCGHVLVCTKITVHNNKIIINILNNAEPRQAGYLSRWNLSHDKATTERDLLID